MEQYKPNSFKYRETMQEEEKKTKSVLDGDIIKSKKTLPKRIIGLFMHDDFETMKKYILNDVLIPNIRNGMYDFLDSSIRVLLGYSENSYRPRTMNSGINSKASYRAAYEKDTRTRTASNDKYADIIIPNGPRAEEKAHDVLAEMKSALRRYGTVSILDYCDVLGIESEHTDRYFGWVDLSEAKIIKVREGYMIKMPKAFPLD